MSTALVILEAIFLLLPATLFYVFGMGIAILGFFSANRGTVTPAFLAIAAFLALKGSEPFKEKLIPGILLRTIRGGEFIAT